jgi:uncharacterized protein
MNRILFCAALLLVLANPARAQFENFGAQADPSLIHVNAEGVASAAPDVFFLEVTVSKQDLDLAKIQPEVAKLCGQVVKAAKAFKLDPARTFTRDYTIVPLRDNQRTLHSYLVSQQFRFALSDLKQAEALTTAVIKAGATTIDSIQFTVAEPDELWELARENAVKNAVQRATRMTKAARANLGSIKTISDRGAQSSNLGCAWSPSDRSQTASDGAQLPEGDHVFFVPPSAVRFTVTLQTSFVIETK